MYLAEVQGYHEMVYLDGDLDAIMISSDVSTQTVARCYQKPSTPDPTPAMVVICRNS